jgi:anaerobic magnesium-protoporphyrin IX monomethyl ester cyclase
MNGTMTQVHGLDVLLINPGGDARIYQELSESLSAIEPPLWCRLIGGYVRDRDLRVDIIDAVAENWGPETVAARAGALSPKLIVVVVFGHQPSASTQQMVAANVTCNALKEICPDTPLLIVGGHVSALPERTLAEENVDFSCKGEGHITVIELLAELEKDREARDFSQVPGLCWRDEEDIRLNEMAPLASDLDGDLHGDVWDLLPMEKYRAHNWQCFGELDSRQPYASIYTSLGCPYKCEFCCINAPFDVNRYRMRSPEVVVAEISHLHDAYGVKTFKIIDEMFVLNERHVLGICDLLIEKGLDLNIWAYARVDTVKAHFLEKLRKAGIRWLALGIESGSAQVRDGSLKALKNDDIATVVNDIQKADINVIGNYIFGLPDDTLETMRQTLNLAKQLNCEFSNFYSAMAYPGSPLFRLAQDNGWPLPESWSGYSQYSYDCQPLPTESLTAAEVLGFRDLAFQECFTDPRYLDMTAQRFGWETRRYIEGMVKHRLSRKILEEQAAQ